MAADATRSFGKLVLSASKLVAVSPCGLACAFGELRPILPNHSVVAPTRSTGSVATLADLSPQEFDALFESVYTVQGLFKADAYNLAVNDGTSAGQPVLLPHVHAHVIPRIEGDLKVNDEIYDAMARWSPEGPETVPPPFYVPTDEERKPRTPEQMAAEAREYAAAAPAAMSGASSETSGGFELVGGATLPTEPQPFGRFTLDASQLFYASEHCVAVVNLKPLCPGHVLCIPKRNVPLMADLSAAERTGLWRFVREVEQIMMHHYGATGCKLAVQDGKAAGQSVPHVHVHILPQK